MKGVVLIVGLALGGAPLPPVVPPVVYERCPVEDAGACTWPGGPIYLERPADRRDLPHELGHQFDYQVLTDADRTKLGFLLRDQRAWNEDPNPPKEKFAEAYSWCWVEPHMTRRYPGWHYGYDYRPKPDRQWRICDLITSLPIPPTPE